MKPEIIDVITWAENCPAIVLFWTMNGNSSPQKVVSTPMNVAAWHKNLYVGKSIFFGPKIIVSKMKSFIKKHIKISLGFVTIKFEVFLNILFLSFKINQP